MKRKVLLGVISLMISVYPQVVLQGEVLFDGEILDRANRYDGYPVHLFDGGSHKIWFCGQSPATGADAIYYSENQDSLASLASWSEPIELFNINDVPWAQQGGGIHVCDPSVIKGDFTYQSASYAYALYFTADTSAGATGDNAIGVAFSNDGVDWTVHDSAVIGPDGGFDGSYGAGAGGVAWGPVSQEIQHVFRDSTTGLGDWRIRWKGSNDGVLFSPPMSLDTQMAQAAASGFGSAPEIAYFGLDERWYGAIQSIAGGDPFTGRILRAWNPGDLFGSWETIAGLDGPLTSSEILLLPSLAKNENSSLFVDREGWAYAFFTYGNHPSNPPGVNSWKIGQARIRIWETPDGYLADSFSRVGQTRKAGDSLDGTAMEAGARDWSSDSIFVFHSDGISTSQTTDSDYFSMVSISDFGPVPLTARGEMRLTGANWIAVGFSETPTQGLFTGELWLLLHRLTGSITLWADGLSFQVLDQPVTFDADSFNTVELTYDPASNSVQAKLNGTELLTSPYSLDAHGFTPILGAAGFHFNKAVAGASAMRKFQLNRPADIFSDSFESGDLGQWSEVTP